MEYTFTGGYAKIPNIGTGDFTVSVWATNSDGTNDYEQMAGGLDNNAPNTGILFGKDAGAGRALTTYAGDGTARVSNFAVPNDGSWHHWVVKRKNGTLYHYKDGIEDSLTFSGVTGSLSQSTEIYSIGGRGLVDNWTGKIDDVRIYNRALSAQEVKRLYNMGHTGP